MKKSLLTLTAVFLFVPAVAAAQEDPVTASLKGLHDITQTNILATARLLDEDLFSYRPTDDVRSMGQILAHVAGAQFTFCAAAAGEQSPSSENFEETRTSKQQIIAALEDGFGYCTQVYGAMTDGRGTEAVSFFGGANTAHGVLAFNSAHNYEHYGNLVTYMRMNGIVPPSSR